MTPTERKTRCGSCSDTQDDRTPFRDATLPGARLRSFGTPRLLLLRVPFRPELRDGANGLDRPPGRGARARAAATGAASMPADVPARKRWRHAIASARIRNAGTLPLFPRARGFAARSRANRRAPFSARLRSWRTLSVKAATAARTTSAASLAPVAPAAKPMRSANLSPADTQRSPHPGAGISAAALTFSRRPRFGRRRNTGCAC